MIEQIQIIRLRDDGQFDASATGDALRSLSSVFYKELNEASVSFRRRDQLAKSLAARSDLDPKDDYPDDVITIGLSETPKEVLVEVWSSEVNFEKRYALAKLQLQGAGHHLSLQFDRVQFRDESAPSSLTYTKRSEFSNGKRIWVENPCLTLEV